jgi:hypothetical protein
MERDSRPARTLRTAHGPTELKLLGRIPMASTTHDARWSAIAGNNTCDRSTEPPSAGAFRRTATRPESQARYLEDLWSVDEEAEALWCARRGRRIAVRCAGWMCCAGMVAVAARIAESPVVRREILAWGTMGTITTPTPGPPVPLPAALPAAEVTPLQPLGESDAGQAIQVMSPDADAYPAEDAGAGASERVSARSRALNGPPATYHLERGGSTLRDARGGHVASRAAHATKAARAPVIAAAPEELIIDDPYDDETPRDKKDDPFVDPYRSP